MLHKLISLNSVLKPDTHSYGTITDISLLGVLTK